jgi:hypothetical protein
MTLRHRLKRLERLPAAELARCRVCGRKPGDVEVIEIVRPAGMPPGPPPGGPPPRPCPGCGRLIPIPMIEVSEEDLALSDRQPVGEEKR